MYNKRHHTKTTAMTSRVLLSFMWVGEILVYVCYMFNYIKVQRDCVWLLKMFLQFSALVAFVFCFVIRSEVAWVNIIRLKENLELRSADSLNSLHPARSPPGNSPTGLLCTATGSVTGVCLADHLRTERDHGSPFGGGTTCMAVGPFF